MINRQYPIGNFQYSEADAPAKLSTWIDTINTFPTKLNTQLALMSEGHLDTPYRPEGWTGRQVVHHLADSHTQALMRFKWSLTEDRPTIKPYKEELYANLPDYAMPIESAILIIQGIHQKWSLIMSEMTADDWQKGYHHSGMNKFFTLYEAAAMYAWHCMHHLGHLQMITTD